jgi:hypothetical protein
MSALAVTLSAPRSSGINAGKELDIGAGQRVRGIEHK